MPHIVLRALATALLVVAPLAGTASAQAPRFDFPTDCPIGYDCWYRAYVDLDPGAAYRDHRCGVRSYEDHRGTDVAPYDPRAARRSGCWRRQPPAWPPAVPTRPAPATKAIRRRQR